MDLLQDFQRLTLSSLTPAQAIEYLLVALACGFLVSRFYYWTYSRTGHSTPFGHALITLAMITAVVIMVIENNLARAFGLVGAMSIIRFRTAVKDVQDIVFIFFSLAVGMAAGVGMTVIAFTTTLLIGLVTLVLGKSAARTAKKRAYLLQFSFAPNDQDEAPYLDVLKKHCRQYQLINVKTSGQDGLLELAYHVNFGRDQHSASLLSDLGQVEGISDLNLFYDDEYS
ncbi:MAG: DUF4956 domain-containing protein [Candidatus Latescibacteria bacterium]|nr:DUF4956 domain-containing protein [Candidatus Latescibacterota bacterium]